jgi:hypothetical protein
VMERGSSCREAVRRVQAWFLASGQTAPDDSTSAYCQARRRLDLALLDKVFQRLCAWFEAQTKRSDLWLGRTVRILDGTGISMPDTKANHRAFDYVTARPPAAVFPPANSSACSLWPPVISATLSWAIGKSTTPAWPVSSWAG